MGPLSHDIFCPAVPDGVHAVGNAGDLAPRSRNTGLNADLGEMDPEVVGCPIAAAERQPDALSDECFGRDRLPLSPHFSLGLTHTQPGVDAGARLFRVELRPLGDGQPISALEFLGYRLSG